MEMGAPGIEFDAKQRGIFRQHTKVAIDKVYDTFVHGRFDGGNGLQGSRSITCFNI